MSLWRLAEAAAWIGGACIFGWILLDAWRTGRRFDEKLLLSSREGEIEDRIDHLPGPKA
ncbi:MAG TPA: hypothetical protein VHV81_06920 [Steroidobacteraceae bacterium]|jgi:hypothetical protein|nr:hypothetical protein [Steroidobacteraceae bacterium]